MEPASGAGAKPTPAQLQAAVELVVQRIDPDQVILFGSAARGQMHEESDIDLLVLRPGTSGERETSQHHWQCEGCNTYVDVLVMSRERAEAGRFIAGDVRQPALEDGVTLYTRTGLSAVATGPGDRRRGRRMIKKTLFDPEHSNVLLDKARECQVAAQLNSPDLSMSWRCGQMAKCMEHCYKALLASLGESVRHTHDLNVLQTTCTAAGANQPATQDMQLLETLTEYSRDFQYGPPPEPESERIFKKALPLVKKLYEYTERQVPAFAQDTRASIEAEKPESGRR